MKALATTATLVALLFAPSAVVRAGTEDVRALAPVEPVPVALHEAGGVAVDAHGTIYVADRKAGTVIQVPRDAGPSIVVRDLHRPFGVALDADERLLVADEHGRIVRREPTGALSVVGSELRKPRWIAAGDDGAIFVSAAPPRPARHDRDDDDDAGDGHVILRSEGGGAFETIVDGLGAVPALAVAGDDLYVLIAGTASDDDRHGTALLHVALDAPAGPFDPETVATTALRGAMGLVLDRGGAIFFAADDPAVHPHGKAGALVKRRRDGQLVTFATGLTEPRAIAFDPAGHLVLTAHDATAPLLRFLAPPPPLVAAPAATREPTVALVGRADPAARVEARAAGAPATIVAQTDADATTGHFSLAVPLAPNAVTTVLVGAVGARGDGLSGAPVSLSARHDDRPPAVTITAPPDAALVRGPVRSAATATDDGSGVVTLAFALDGRAVGDVIGPEPSPRLEADRAIDTATLADGAHTLSVTAADAAGNTASATRTVVVDNTAPDTRIVDGPTGQVTATAVTFVVTGTDNLSAPEALTFAWRLDGGPWSLPAPGPGVALAGLAAGTHVFEAKAIDAAGNEDATPAQRAFTVALAPPPSSVALALAQMDAIRKAVAAMVRAGACSWGTSCLGTGYEGFTGIQTLVNGGWLSAGDTVDPWGGRFGVVGGVSGYAIKVHGLPTGSAGDALCAQLAAGLVGQTIGTRVWGGYDQKMFEAAFPNP